MYCMWFQTCRDACAVGRYLVEWLYYQYVGMYMITCVSNWWYVLECLHTKSREYRRILVCLCPVWSSYWCSDYPLSRTNKQGSPHTHKQLTVGLLEKFFEYKEHKGWSASEDATTNHNIQVSLFAKRKIFSLPIKKNPLFSTSKKPNAKVSEVFNTAL